MKKNLPVLELLFLPEGMPKVPWDNTWDSVAVLDRLNPRKLPRLDDGLYDAARRISSFMDGSYGEGDYVFDRRLREVYHGIEKTDTFGVVHVTGIKPFLEKFVLTRVGVKDPSIYVDFTARIYYAGNNSHHCTLREGLKQNRQRYFREMAKMDPHASLTHPMYREYLLRHLAELQGTAQ